MLPPRKEPGGVALVVTLMMMSILTMMVVGLSGVMRNEQAAARNLTYQVLAGQMAEIGAQEAMARVLSNSPVSGVAGVTGPGWTLTNGVLVPLFSSNAAGAIVNLEGMGTNSLVLALATNQSGQILANWTNVIPPGGSANLPVGRYAWWVDEEGTKANVNQVGGDKSSAAATSLLPSQTNFPLSAAPFFLDDPVAGTGNNNSLANRLTNRSTTFPTLETLKLPTASGGVGLNSTNYRNFKGNMTVWSSNVDLTPWGTPRINLADLGVSDAASRDAAYDTLRAALKTNAWAAFFPVGSLAQKYGGGGATAGDSGNHGDLALDQIAANLLAAATTNQWPIQCNQFQSAAGNNAVGRFRNDLPLSLSSDHLGPYLSEVWVRIDAVTANTIQTVAGGRGGGTSTNILGSIGSVRLGLMVRLTNPYSQPMANFRLEIQPRKFRFKVLQDSITYANRSPLPAPSLVQMGALTQGAENPTLSANALSWVTLEGRAGTPLGWWLGPEWLKDLGGTMRIFPWDLGQIFSVVLSDTSLTDPPIFSKTINFQMNANAAGALNAAGLVNETFVQIDQVRLVDTTAGGRLVDWMSMDDLAQEGNFRSTTSLTETIDPAEDYGQLPFGVSGRAINASILRGAAPAATLPTLTSNSFTPANAWGIFRTDPRVRFPLSHWDTSGSQRGVLRPGGWPATVKAWTLETNVAVRQTNTGIAGLPADPVTSTPVHPHFVAGYLPTNGIRSVAQLGAIHTGLPWRTLRLLPTPATELAMGPPDWVLLDLFTVTNPATPRPMINVNSVGRDRAGQIQVNGTPAHRGWAVMGAMGILTNSRTGFFGNAAVFSQLAMWGIPESFATDNNARISATGANAFANIGPGLRDALANPGTAANWYTGATAAQSSGWASFRAGANSLWPSQGMAFRGELAELSALTQAGTALSEEQQEGRLRFFMDLLTTRSDTFTVWSAGQGLVVFTNTLGQVRTNVMGEVRKQTVFQRVPTTNSTGQVTGWNLQVLYTRNHVVE